MRGGDAECAPVPGKVKFLRFLWQSIDDDVL